MTPTPRLSRSGARRPSIVTNRAQPLALEANASASVSSAAAADIVSTAVMATS
jgi:hypothetical protein